MEDTANMFIVDAFTNLRFGGNPAAVCYVGKRNLNHEVMQKIAAEMNLSETAFLQVEKDDYATSDHFGLRWFTPTNEVPLCGHATLAAAATLFYELKNPNPVITFSTMSGNLLARNDKGYISLDLPVNTPVRCNEELTLQLKRMYEVIFTPYAEEQVENAWISNTTKKLLIKMKNNFTREDMESLKPDTAKMTKIHDGSIYKGIIITVKAGDGSDSNSYDFLSRYFAPWNGIPEDPVTGSAHTVLTPFWHEIIGKREMLARQCSKRGGDIKVIMRDDGRVDIAGKSIVILRGQLMLPTSDGDSGVEVEKTV